MNVNKDCFSLLGVISFGQLITSIVLKNILMGWFSMLMLCMYLGAWLGIPEERKVITKRRATTHRRITRK